MILLVIDMQKGLVDEDLYDYESFTENVRKLIDAARDNNVEVIYFRHDAGPGSGFSAGDESFEIAEGFEPAPGEKVFDKTINSCFGNKEFKTYMKQQEDRRLMIAGLQTNYCIDATVKSALERGYEVIIPEGSNSTFDNNYMTGETTVRYYNEDVWEELVESVTVDEAIDMMKG
ncbi:MAG: cysteine hydrolase [Oscillospiraceae bacterium]|nr:cysteine hydrolase [Oscillospiraceae bacterium]